MFSVCHCIVTSGGQDWRLVETCPLQDPPTMLTSAGYWSMYVWGKQAIHILLECFLVAITYMEILKTKWTHTSCSSTSFCSIQVIYPKPAQKVDSYSKLKTAKSIKAAHHFNVIESSKSRKKEILIVIWNFTFPQSLLCDNCPVQGR